MTSLGGIGTTLGGGNGTSLGSSLGNSVGEVNANNPLSSTTTLGGTSLSGSTSSLGSSGSSASSQKKKQQKKKKAAAAVQVSAAEKICYLPQSQSDDEGILDYKVGGYHPVSKDDVFNGRYQVIDKLGWGHFSTVWLCLDRDSKRKVALKIVRSAKSYTETAEDEIQLLTASAGTSTVATLLDNFIHKGPHGRHVCMVFEVLGNNLLDLIKHYRYRGIPLTLVKSIMKQVIIGLDHLHTKCKVIHTDLKPENVLLRRSFDSHSEDFSWGQIYGFYKHNKQTTTSSTSDSNDTTTTTSTTTTTVNNDNLDNDTSKERQYSRESSLNKEKSSSNAGGSRVAHPRDLLDDKDKKSLENKIRESGGSAAKDNDVEMDNNNLYVNGKTFVIDNTRDGECLTDTHYPEVEIVDLGNGCWIDRHFTDDIQTRQYRSPEAIVRGKWSTPVDVWSAACMAFELATGDHLFKPKSGKSFDKSDDHLALMIELLGKFPRSITSLASRSKEYFNHKGELRRITKLSAQWPLYNVLTEKYKFSHKEASEFEDFLLPMLNYNPEKRATAKDCLNHPFLKNAPPYNTNI